MGYNKEQIITFLSGDSIYSKPEIITKDKGVLYIKTYSSDTESISTFILFNGVCKLLVQSIPMKYLPAEKENLKSDLSIAENVWIDRSIKVAIVIYPDNEDGMFYKKITLLTSLRK